VYENSPTIFPIGLELGVPVIASRMGVIGELISERINGYLFCPGDQPDLERVFRAILGD
jgi:glycosyltransferase involved in cell wall biosynthesis